MKFIVLFLNPTSLGVALFNVSSLSFSKERDMKSGVSPI